MQLQTIKLQEHILIQTFGRFVNCTVNYMNKVSTSHKWMKDWFQFIYCSKLLREGSPETLRPLFKIFSRSSLKKWGKRRELGCTINYVFWGPIETTGPPEQRQSYDKDLLKHPSCCLLNSKPLLERQGRSVSCWPKHERMTEEWKAKRDQHWRSRLLKLANKTVLIQVSHICLLPRAKILESPTPSSSPCHTHSLTQRHTRMRTDSFPMHRHRSWKQTFSRKFFSQVADKHGC